MDLLSEKLEEPNIHKEQLTERVTRLVEYKKLENKPRNGVISNISDDSQITEWTLARTPTLNKCPIKELEETNNNDAENTIRILTLQIPKTKYQML